jgi:hypothetical protein
LRTAGWLRLSATTPTLMPSLPRVARFRFSRLEEIGRLLSNYPDIAKAKLVFPGAEITEIRHRSVEDPLKSIHDVRAASANRELSSP